MAKLMPRLQSLQLSIKTLVLTRAMSGWPISMAALADATSSLPFDIFYYFRASRPSRSSLFMVLHSCHGPGQHLLSSRSNATVNQAPNAICRRVGAHQIPLHLLCDHLHIRRAAAFPIHGLARCLLRAHRNECRCHESLIRSLLFHRQKVRE